jgi:uncharacterized protein YcfL
MTSEQFDSPRPATGTDAETTLADRTTILNQLVISNYRDLQDTAYAAYPDLMVFDAEKIILQLGKKMNRYTGPPTEAPFMKWATRFMTKEAKRYAIAASLLSEYGILIRTTIRKEIDRPIRDYSVDVNSVYPEVALLIFDRAPSLAKRGTAKTSTRIVSLIKKHVHLYYHSYWYRRHKLNTERVQSGQGYGVETMSEEELKAERAALDDQFQPESEGVYVS